MTLIDHARSTSPRQLRDVALIGPMPVPSGSVVWSPSTMYAEGGVQLTVAAISDLRLQAVVIGQAEVGQHVDLTDTPVDGTNWTCGIGFVHRSGGVTPGRVRNQHLSALSGGRTCGPTPHRCLRRRV